MDEDRTTLEHLLRDRAAEIPYFQAAPPRMLAKARRRIARNAIASLAAVGLIVVGASAGLANLGALRGPDRVPQGSTGSHGPTQTAPAPCGTVELIADASLEGAAGSVIGTIDLTSVGTSTCTLTGRPTITIDDAAGDAVAFQVVVVDPQWRVDRASPPRGWPVVLLSPGDVASVRVRWSNPCPQLTAPVRWTVGLDDASEPLDVRGADTTPPPSCNGAGEPSTLEVGPFEPAADA
jgi:hypothetical protein